MNSFDIIVNMNRSECQNEMSVSHNLWRNRCQCKSTIILETIISDEKQKKNKLHIEHVKSMVISTQSNYSFNFMFSPIEKMIIRSVRIDWQGQFDIEC